MSSKKRLYDFGPYRLDPVKRQLLRDEQPVALTPKAFDILLLLVEAGEQGLERNDLIAHIWPDSFVEENILTVNISTLRKALGEQRGENRYIATIPGKGYRFVADVHELWDGDSEVEVIDHTRTHVIIEPKDDSFSGTTTHPIPLRRPRRLRLRVMFWRRLSRQRVWLAISILSVCLLSGGLIWNYGLHPSRPVNTEWRNNLKFIRMPGMKSDRQAAINSGRLSPQGNLIVFAATGEGLNLRVLQIGGGQPIQITRGPWHDDSPIWSPSGDRIAFISDRNHEIGIWTVPFIGGEPPTLLKTIESSDAMLKGGTALRHWSKQGILYFSWNNNLHALDMNSKAVTQMTHFDSAAGLPGYFRVSPDEEWVAYVNQQDGQFDIWRMPLRGGDPIRVTDDSAIESRPVWHPDMKRIIYSAKIEGRFRLYQAYLDGRPPELITFTEDESCIWDVSADGTRLLCYGKRDESDIWQVSLDTKEETQLTFDNGIDFWPQVSPDGRMITIQRLQGEKVVWDPTKSSLLVSDVAAGSQGLPLAANAYAAQWSPDGQKIAFLRDSEGVTNLFTVKAMGGEETQLTDGGMIFGGFTIGPSFNEFCTKDYCWSPDSSNLAYCSQKGGAPNLWLLAANGTGEMNLSNNADPKVSFSCPIWSPDGRRLAYVTSSGGQRAGNNQSWTLWVTNRETSESIFTSEAIVRLTGWDASGNNLITATVTNQGMNRVFPAGITLSRILLAERRPQVIARIEAAYFATVQLSPDRRNISCVATYEGRDEILVLPVDGGETRKITSNTDPTSCYASLAWSPDGKHLYCGKQTSRSLITVIDNFK
jgi:Tol biopolymer transport system component/DNA-binding winged helix-turn-helix (wHTH) protein